MGLTRKQKHEVSTISPQLELWLLTGEIDLSADRDDELFNRAIWFEWPDVAVQLWKEHAPRLREAAKRRGIEPRFGGLFFAEYELVHGAR